MRTPHILTRGFPSQPVDCRTSSRPCIKLPSHLHAKLSSALGPDLATEAGKWSGRATPCVALAPLSNYLPSKASHPLQHPAKLDRDTIVKRRKDFRVAKLPCSPSGCISHPMVVTPPTFPALSGRKQAQQRGRSDKVRQGQARSDEVRQGQPRSELLNQWSLCSHPLSLTPHFPPSMCVVGGVC